MKRLAVLTTFHKKMIQRMGVLGLLFFILGQPLTATPDWELIHSEAGVKVYRQEVPGENLFSFKASGMVYADWVTTLGVITDLGQAKEWVDRLQEVKLVKQISHKEQVIYSRFSAPWPLNDRDVVFSGKLIFSDKTHWMYMSLVNTNYRSIPAGDSVVRMPLLRNVWRIKPVRDGKATFIEFEAQADPGGVVPNWVANLVGKEVPLKSMKSLRKQVVDAQLDKRNLGLMLNNAVKSGAPKRAAEIRKIAELHND